MAPIAVRYDDLNDCRALVTGGSGGLGLVIAEALLSQGARVVVHYHAQRDAAEELSSRFIGRAWAVGADLSRESGCRELVERTLTLLGGLDQLVHSAGVWTSGPMHAISAVALEETFRINTFSAFYLIREALTALRASGRGNIVLIGSTAGQRGEPGHAHYAASKGALQSLSMSLAVELAPAVRTNMVSPGWVRTPMARDSLETIAGRVARTVPNRRIAEPQDVANAVLYLASRASSHLVGQDLAVSGGALLVVPRGQIDAVQDER